MTDRTSGNPKGKSTGSVKAEAGEPANGAANAAVSDSPTVSLKPKRGGGWLKGLGLLLVLGLGLLWFAPTVVAITELRQQLVPLAMPGFSPKFQIGGAEFSWLSPIELRDVTVRLKDGSTLVTIPKIRSEKSLYQMALSANAPGPIQIIEPKLTVLLRPDGSNVEDVINELSAMPGSGGAFRYQIQVSDAQVELIDNMTETKHQLQRVAAGVDAARDAKGDYTLDAKTSGEAKVDGHFDIAFAGKLPAPDLLPVTGKLLAKTVDFPLALTERIVARFSPDRQLAGGLNTDLSADWDLSAQRQGKVAGKLGIANGLVIGQPFANSEIPPLGNVSLGVDAELKQKLLTVNSCQLSSTPGNMTAKGTVTVPEGDVSTWMSQLAAQAETENYEGSTEIELRQLAGLFPQLLRIREGTVVTAGKLTGSVKSSQEGAGHTWQGRADLVDLAATEAGKTLAWQEPIRCQFKFDKTGDQWRLAELVGTSGFAKLTGSGSLDELNVDGTIELGKLTTEIGKFFELSGQRLAGQAQLAIKGRRTSPNEVDLKSGLSLAQFTYAQGNRPLWQDPKCDVALVSRLKLDGNNQPVELADTEVKVVSGLDQLTAIAAQPISLKTNPEKMSAMVTLTGALERWQPRLRPFVDLSGYELSGQTKATTEISKLGSVWTMSKLESTVTDLQLLGNGLAITDPMVEVQSSGTFDMATNQFQSPLTKIVSRAVQLDLTDTAITTADRLQLATAGQVKGDMAALARWFMGSSLASTGSPVGTLAGTFGLKPAGEWHNLQWDLAVDRGAWMMLQTGSDGQSKWSPIWQEPRATSKGSGQVDWISGRAKLDEIQFANDGLSLVAGGSIEGLYDQPRVDLKGDLGYDWAKLSGRLPPDMAQHVQVTGKDQRKLSLRGSLAAPISSGVQPAVAPVAVNTVGANLTPLSGEFGLGWNQLMAYGLQVGPSQLGVKLVEGQAEIVPIDTTVNEGRLYFAPSLETVNGQTVVKLPKGPLIEKVRISPELCAEWLKYMAPLVANSAVAEGSFSVQLTKAAVPVADVTNSDIGGQLQIHSGQVRPGPVVEQLIGTINQVKGLVTRNPNAVAIGEDVFVEIPEQATDFRLLNGRMHHRQLTFNVGEVALLTSGSVGLDETLDLRIEVPVQDDWLGNGKFGQALKGKSIPVPLGGTLSRPRVDPSIFRELAKQFAGSFLEGEVGDLLGKELDKPLEQLDGALERFLGRPKPKK